MPSDRSSLKVRVLAEDKRTERFIRHLLTELGFDPRQVRFRTAPAGERSGEAWVKINYPEEVRILRSKNFQHLALIAIRDGDAVGVSKRKEELDDVLEKNKMQARQDGERIATPVPTWAIENWLLDLLATAGIDEGKKDAAGQRWKHRFESSYKKTEGDALKNSVAVWQTLRSTELSSLTDGRSELARLDL